MKEFPSLDELETKVKLLIDELKAERARKTPDAENPGASEKLNRIEGRIKKIIQLLDQQ